AIIFLVRLGIQFRFRGRLCRGGPEPVLRWKFLFVHNRRGATLGPPLVQLPRPARCSIFADFASSTIISPGDRQRSRRRATLLDSLYMLAHRRHYRNALAGSNRGQALQCVLQRGEPDDAIVYVRVSYGSLDHLRALLADTVLLRMRKFVVGSLLAVLLVATL